MLERNIIKNAVLFEVENYLKELDVQQKSEKPHNRHVSTTYLLDDIVSFYAAKAYFKYEVKYVENFVNNAIEDWLKENSKLYYINYNGRTVLFVNNDDAVQFKLIHGGN